jgi:hypothetical protein
MKAALLLLSLFLSVTRIAEAQDAQPFTKVNFVIVQSTKDYAVAKATALSAAQKLNYKLDLRDLKPHKKTGLTFSKAVCENDGGYPCYIARGRYDAGEYVSIEWSDEITGFAKGYYVVIIASGDADLTKAALKKARAFFKDAYSKSAQVYVGCMH